MSDTEKKIKHLRKHVLAVLEAVPKSRDSDQYLTLCIWNRYYPQYVREIEVENPHDTNKSKVKMVALVDIMHLPREDNVKRIRAKIQNEEHKFLPTSLEVAKQRKINEEVWRKYTLNN